MLKIATLFGIDFYADTDDKKKSQVLEDYVLELEAREKFPHGDNYGIQIRDGEFLNSLLGIAQMLQREEHFNNSKE